VSSKKLVSEQILVGLTDILKNISCVWQDRNWTVQPKVRRALKYKKTGNVHINVTMRHVGVAIVTVKKAINITVIY